jgi:hypothetical protein
MLEIRSVQHDDSASVHDAWLHGVLFVSRTGDATVCSILQSMMCTGLAWRN